MSVLSRLFATCACLVLLAACAGSPPSRFYTLASPVPPAASPARGPAVTVGPVAIPAVVDRPEIVVTIGPNEVWPDEFNRWAGPLADAVGLALVGHLTVLLPSPDVTLLAQSSGGPADVRVAVEVQRFESVPGSHALVDAVYTVRHSADGRSRSGRTTAREATSDKGYDALAAAHSRAVATLAADIVVAVRALAAAPAAPSPAR